MTHGRIPALHFLRQKDSSASQQHSSAAPGKFQRPIILRESGFPRDTEGFRRCIFCGKKIPAHHSNIPAPHLEISSGPLFCGNEDSCETRKDSRAAFFAARRFQRITATFQRRTLFVMRSSLWMSDRARDFIILDKSPMKPPRLGEQNFSPILFPSLVSQE